GWVSSTEVIFNYLTLNYPQIQSIIFFHRNLFIYGFAT
ncbi:uncharacterized protein METZ01_LOCUS82988, partial [marine metagenome]